VLHSSDGLVLSCVALLLQLRQTRSGEAYPWIPRSYPSFSIGQMFGATHVTGQSRSHRGHACVHIFLPSPSNVIYEAMDRLYTLLPLAR
jgi:hypothetical protein